MTRWLRASVVSLAALMAGCSAPAPGRQGWITLGTVSSPTNLDPGVGLDEASQRIHQLVYSALVKIGPDLRIVPDLAVRFETTDYTTYIAEIPKGVRFHDGREMTSEDVAYTFRRFLDPAFTSGRKGAYSNLAAVDIVDAYTVAFRLKTPSGAFPGNLSLMGIVPAGAGATLARTPVGSGPYKVTEFVADSHVMLEAFADYYQGAPKNAGLVLKVVPDDTMRSLELRNGSVDLVVNDISPDLAHSLATAPTVDVVTGPGTDYAYIGVNLTDAILKDRRVRQALAHAIDRRDITSHLRRDQARETSGIIPPMSWAYVPDLPTFPYDPAEAKRLLDAAGHPDPDGDGPELRFRLTLKTSTAEPYRLQAAIIQQHLSRVGIGLDLRSYEFATLFSDVVRGNFQLYTLVFTGGSVADPDILRRVFHSGQMPPSGFNRGRYSNPDVDALIDRATAANAEADRRQLYGEAQRLIAADVPVLSLWVRRNVAVARRGLSGVTLTPLGDFEFLRHVSAAP
jgi:peptide/nickel transport system substrate-binding protein